MSFNTDPLVLNCAACKMEVRDPHSTDHILPDGIPYGTLWVCGGCGKLNKMGITQMEAVSDEEYETFDEDTKREIGFALRAVRHPQN